MPFQPKAPTNGRIVHAPKPVRGAQRVGDTAITHADRELWPGITKQDLAEYWTKVAPQALPGIAADVAAALVASECLALVVVCGFLHRTIGVHPLALARACVNSAVITACSLAVPLLVWLGGADSSARVWSAVALGGGVAANGPLRKAVAVLCEREGVRLKLVPGRLCTDNAAMIGSAGRFASPIPYPDYLSYVAFASCETAAA